MAERSEAKSANHCVKISQILILALRYFDAKLRFALLAPLRSVIACEI